MNSVPRQFSRQQVTCLLQASPGHLRLLVPSAGLSWLLVASRSNCYCWLQWSVQFICISSDSYCLSKLITYSSITYFLHLQRHDIDPQTKWSVIPKQNLFPHYLTFCRFIKTIIFPSTNVDGKIVCLKNLFQIDKEFSVSNSNEFSLSISQNDSNNFLPSFMFSRPGFENSFSFTQILSRPSMTFKQSTIQNHELFALWILFQIGKELFSSSGHISDCFIFRLSVYEKKNKTFLFVFLRFIFQYMFSPYFQDFYDINSTIPIRGFYMNSF